jgi:hypothetical protein
MTTATVLVASWSDGVFVCGPDVPSHELAGELVQGLAPDGRGGALAVVGKHSLQRRSAEGTWTTLATSQADLSCCQATPNGIFVGTDDARLMRLVDGRLEPLPGFDAVDGRETWYAGTAVIDGKVVGPPLGIRSMAASSDGAQLFVNVHVGGIPRSADGGISWQPTIDVATDVHEVRVHPHRPEIVAAAAAVGLCTSRDGGSSWQVETKGLHGKYCSAVAFVGDDILVAASEEHFSAKGAVYRRPIDEPHALVRVAGLPGWLHGIADTHCVFAKDDVVAIVDRQSTLYLSEDAGADWSVRARDLATASGALIL